MGFLGTYPGIRTLLIGLVTFLHSYLNYWHLFIDIIELNFIFLSVFIDCLHAHCRESTYNSAEQVLVLYSVWCVGWQVYAMSEVYSAECYQQRVTAAAWQDNWVHQSNWPCCQQREGIGFVWLVGKSHIPLDRTWWETWPRTLVCDGKTNENA